MYSEDLGFPRIVLYLPEVSPKFTTVTNRPRPTYREQGKILVLGGDVISIHARTVDESVTPEVDMPERCLCIYRTSLTPF
jgi:hypothetical protein